ncbi:tRNA lysidine(34) synthetase TilS [Microlunatus antarcticus]|uniref:tRNA(Ile)-lysidine synthase n=1 Tax=Microlunatus antarcticus TaxID=53388 RepID=A0A7W5JS51_9ACTN|nr:tRNA lysidine(34) synthetase TilS [Microlunatus antarcticus]MBB3325332.1 tRNA(Ile)-lysidine synthase [Microlunatus antarcticus]
MSRRALGPATLAVVQAVAAALEPADTSLLVACSGGPDSLALAAGVAHVARASGRAYAAVVVDHGLQEGSAEVADAARVALTGLGYEDVTVVRGEVARTYGAGPEAAAREVRYAALRSECEDRGATLLLGHTRDDQAETVLLGLARGSGARSLAGMAVRGDGRLRPLLGLPRATTVACCDELGLAPWSDPHNADPAYARVRVRSTVLPVLEAELGPGVAAALARSAELLRADADLLDRLAADARSGAEREGGLACAHLATLPTALRTRVLRDWLRTLGAHDLTADHLAAVDALVTDWHGQGPAHLPGLRVGRTDGLLRAL